MFEIKQKRKFPWSFSKFNKRIDFFNLHFERNEKRREEILIKFAY